MPELPEVRTIQAQILDEIKQHEITHLCLTTVKGEILGKSGVLEYIDFIRKGKYMTIQTKQNNILLHLGMTGKLNFSANVENTTQEMSKAYKHCTGIFTFKQLDPVMGNFIKKFRIVFTDPRRFGELEPFAPNTEHPRSKVKGVDILSPEFTFEYFDNKMTTGNGKRLGVFLMDQKNMSGIGNYLRSEIMFDAGVSPFKMARNVTKAERVRLYESILRLIEFSIDKGGCSISQYGYRDIYGNLGQFQNYLSVYQKDGTTCSNCGDSLIERSDLLGAQNIFFCPTCQPE